MAHERILALARDLTRVAPRSARAPLGPYGVIAARALDKCRAELADRAGSYHYNCALDRSFFDFTGIDAPYEEPENPEITIHTDRESVKESVGRLLDFLIPRLQLELAEYEI